MLQVLVRKPAFLVRAGRFSSSPDYQTEKDNSQHPVQPLVSIPTRWLALNLGARGLVGSGTTDTCQMERGALAGESLR